MAVPGLAVRIKGSLALRVHMIVAGLVTAIWIVLLLLPDRPWHMREVLPARSGSSSGQRVSVLIPARNEERVIGQCLAALSDQMLPLEIMVLDDGSTDHTQKVACASSLDSLKVVEIPELPPGWTGKLWALEQGLARVHTEWVLLLDADIALGHGLLPTLLATAERDGLGLASVMATPALRGFWDRWLMPVFIYFFKWVYPFHRANDPTSRMAAAAGGCVLVKLEALHAIGGFSALRDAVIDDCTLARLVKRKGYPTWIGVSRSVRMLRAHAFGEIWQMVSRTAFAQLHYSYFALLLAMAGLLFVFALPPVLALSGPDGLVRLLGTASSFLLVLSYLPTARFYDESPFWGILLPLAAALFFLMSVHSALRYARGTRTRWKGRTYDRNGS